ncbi:hypothetical protein PHLCEN_2v762 [Hermanssonia centrifuga]|uniref:Uncharacterized protein n=1 Tax=Hermanssonia centrifuga TaxID=98765 RepID=A0A2R6S540_9APHY|nr:hypothetical protein PHLCEN_2v762 [Hermanssonia centrifuga]
MVEIHELGNPLLLGGRGLLLVDWDTTASGDPCHGLLILLTPFQEHPWIISRPAVKSNGVWL